MPILGYALAIVIGLSLGLLGGGGAILTVPVLVYALGVGVKEAVPTSLVVVGLTSLLGAVHHGRAGQVHGRAVLAFGPGAMAGAVLGAFAALRIGGRFQLALFGIVLLAAALRMFRQPIPVGGPTEEGPRPLPFLATLGAGVGFLTGLLGVGGGFLYVPALHVFGGLDMRRAVGTSLALIALGATTGFAGYLGRVELNWPLVAGFTALAFVGVGIGTALVAKVPQESLRRGFALLLLVMGLMVLIRR